MRHTVGNEMNSSAQVILAILLGLAAIVWAGKANPAELIRVETHITVVLHDNVVEISKTCGKPSRGCHVNTGIDTSEIHVLAPMSWCDITAVFVIGHETMHSMGFRHADIYGPPSLSQTGCANGEWLR